MNIRRRVCIPFIAAYNETAKPFVWAKAKVYQKLLKERFADQ